MAGTCWRSAGNSDVLAFAKAHAYGNDFLYVTADTLGGVEAPSAARRLCDRHRGVGADGLILYTPTPLGASMKLLNADGSPAELSGNGLRGLAAILMRARDAQGTTVNPVVEIETTAGLRRLTLDSRDGSRYVFAAEMGAPLDLHQEAIDAGGEHLTVSILSIGNPQCVVLGPLPDDERFARVGQALERHARFPEGTNVEFALVESPERVRIRIWERGVGPTESSGTGSCAAAVVAAAHGGASRRVEVASPGGTQIVEWAPDGVVLTGWAEILCDGLFCADL
jgi:diaminopimelate epimerase